MKLRCPRCQQKLSVPDKYAGRGVRCPACNRAFNVPTPKASTDGLADKVDLDLEGLADLEQHSSELDERELKAVEKAQKARASANQPDPNLRTCPACDKQTRAHDPYVEILCSHCWNPIPALEREFTNQDVKSILSSRSTTGFYGDLMSCLTYPIPALGSILTAAGVAFVTGLVPLAVISGLTNVMEQSNFGYDDISKADLSKLSLLLMGIFAAEVFIFSAIALHGFLDVIRATSIGTEKPPLLTWNPSQWGNSFLGYLVLVVYYAAMSFGVLTLTVEGGVPMLWSTKALPMILQTGGTAFIVGMVVISMGVPMNLLGMALGNVVQAMNPMRVVKSVGRTHAHYLFLLLLVCMYGIFFGGAFWTIVHDWFVPQIEKMVRGSREGNLTQVAIGLLAWGVIMSCYFYGSYVLGRIHGIFARSFRRDLAFGTM